MTAYLIDHKPRIRQYRQRGTTISGVVVLHTAESYPDEVGPDTGAENVARFIQQRTNPGSYHWLADSDSLVDLIPMTLTAYGEGTGTNSHSIHISAATQAHRWGSLSDEWIAGTVENMALAAHKASNKLERVHGVRIPARRVTAAQARNRVEGFLAHGDLDPGRRSDPGAGFPWDLFFREYRELEARKAEPEDPTRGKQVDLALRRASATITAIDKAGPEGKGPRAVKLDEAEAAFRQGRRILRSIAILNAEEAGK